MYHYNRTIKIVSETKHNKNGNKCTDQQLCIKPNALKLKLNVPINNVYRRKHTN